MIKYKFTHICVAKLENIDLSILGGAGYTQFWDRAHTCYFSLPTYFAQQEREAGKRKMKVKRERERGQGKRKGKEERERRKKKRKEKEES